MTYRRLVLIALSRSLFRSNPVGRLQGQSRQFTNSAFHRRHFYATAYPSPAIPSLVCKDTSQQISTATMTKFSSQGLRRSRRIHAQHHPLQPFDELDTDSVRAKYNLTKKVMKRTTKDSTKRGRKQSQATVKAENKPTTVVTTIRQDGLSRTRERQVQATDDQTTSRIVNVIGVDEAGRGPLAGPVVAAAIILPPHLETIPGVVDSKKLTKEDDREVMYEEIVSTPNIRWAVSIIDAARIDEINILQATLQGMKMAVTAVMDPPNVDSKHRALHASIEQSGCYVVCSPNSISDKVNVESISNKDHSLTDEIRKEPGASNGISSMNYHALIDGNKLPKDMPCNAEYIIKGDSKECCIAAASILAKVTRDRLMHGYDKLYPQYNLGQHKGYPTAAHMAAVHEYGASPIHRRSFAPLKHMKFDEDGKIVKSQSEVADCDDKKEKKKKKKL